jgi:hypothetical protein
MSWTAGKCGKICPRQSIRRHLANLLPDFQRPTAGVVGGGRLDSSHAQAAKALAFEIVQF